MRGRIRPVRRAGQQCPTMQAPSIEPNPRVTYKLRFRDEHMLVLEKPAGVVTQPGVGHQHDTLLNGLFHEFGPQLQQLGQARDFGLVHRLDKETSGLLAVALTAPAYDALREQFAARGVRKFYWAVCGKAPKEPEGVIRKPIEEETRRTSRYTSVKIARLTPAGKPAVTAYRVLDATPLGALIEARPVTGRLHQVRVHLASIGAAIFADEVYARKTLQGAAHRLALHAHRLVVEHPVSGEEIDVRTPWPRDLRALLKRLGLKRPDVEAPRGGAEDAGGEEE